MLQCTLLLRYQRALTSLTIFPGIWRQFLLETELWYAWTLQQVLSILALLVQKYKC
jgi:hypothetical protein